MLTLLSLYVLILIAGCHCATLEKIFSIGDIKSLHQVKVSQAALYIKEYSDSKVWKRYSFDKKEKHNSFEEIFGASRNLSVSEKGTVLVKQNLGSKNAIIVKENGRKVKFFLNKPSTDLVMVGPEGKQITYLHDSFNERSLSYVNGLSSPPFLLILTTAILLSLTDPELWYFYIVGSTSGILLLAILINVLMKSCWKGIYALQAQKHGTKNKEPFMSQHFAIDELGGLLDRTFETAACGDPIGIEEDSFLTSALVYFPPSSDTC